MLKKFNHINCATYKNFNWELNEFGKINIIYGHNGAGKTVLSRLIRSFETKELPQGYDDIKFKIQINSNNYFSETDIKNADFEVRVYNRDFVNKNLNFLINGENSGSILSFQSAILGEHNDIIFRAIKELENKIGKKPDPENAIIASGFVGDIIYITQQIEDKIREKSKKENDLNSKLSKIAQDIKYSSLLAEPNYNITKVKEEIKNITLENLDSNILNDEQLQININRLRDESKEAIKLNFNFQQAQMSEILSQAKILVEEKLTPREEIQDELRKWLEAGLDFHSHTKEEQECKFCKGKVSKERITELLENLNDERRQINKSKIEKLTNLIKDINNNYEKYLKNIHAIRKEALYLEYQEEGEKIKNDAEEIFNKYNNLLKTILKKLGDKYENPYKDIIFGNFTDNSNEVAKIIEDFKNLANKNNKKTDRLSKDKEDAKKAIITSEISKKLKDIDYFSKQQEIEELDNELNRLNNYKNDKIKEKEEAEEKKRKLHDEISSEQASINNINRYLNSFFGNETLQFRVLEDKVGEFEILRNGQKADNLSEGECTLIGFCYFMAKLQDLKTDGTNPIIWIDDPISSLDSNHIFFVFSLIDSELFNKDKELKYQQLFISTHNLDFLKYLKQLTVKDGKKNRFIAIKNDRENKFSRMYMIQKDENGSKIVDMPKFLKDYTTEFSYLFEQIYKHKNINEIDNEDTKTILTYNFGNNLRKFLEIYLFFKYPQKKSLGVETIERFFGSTQNAILLNRYIQEYSHLREILERGMKPLDIPESKKIAEFVLETIKKKDPEQYEALCESIKEKDIEISKKRLFDE
ncbi:MULTISPECIES: AAA family ATPase [Campylobacter]|uniref:AAA family ATPase n=1 Tax=Campylobacter vicugnae TaxID=1660076 RepID=A0ABZ2E7E4_9BACT|nr:MULTISPECIES: AAA family ATPase [unclassified Campylobacter]MCR8690577.1 AAA family ATPase [Campylobacter sp. RM9264]MCR8701514.1 AAA family ATPase [Campylobacter sp. RM12176]